MKKKLFFVTLITILAVTWVLPGSVFAWRRCRNCGPDAAGVLFGIATIIRATNPCGGGPYYGPPATDNPYGPYTKVWVPPVRERVWVSGHCTGYGRWVDGYWSTRTVRPGHWSR